MSDTTNDAIKTEVDPKNTDCLQNLFLRLPAPKSKYMKTQLLTIAIFISAGSFAQKNIPASVQEAFKKNFPGVEVKKWDKEDGNYEANFSKDTKTMSATFDANGNWLETETEMQIKDLPASVAEYVKAHYAGVAIKEAASLKTPKGNMYEAEVKGKDLLFDMSGKFIKEEND